jgi:hypothetical protein
MTLTEVHGTHRPIDTLDFVVWLLDHTLGVELDSCSWLLVKRQSASADKAEIMTLHVINGTVSHCHCQPFFEFHDIVFGKWLTVKLQTP